MKFSRDLFVGIYILKCVVCYGVEFCVWRLSRFMEGTGIFSLPQCPDQLWDPIKWVPGAFPRRCKAAGPWSWPFFSI